MWRKEAVQRANPNIAQRGNAFMRICEAASHSEERDIDIRKTVLERVIQLSPELGTEKSANILTTLLFDPCPEVSNIPICPGETAIIFINHIISRFVLRFWPAFLPSLKKPMIKASRLLYIMLLSSLVDNNLTKSQRFLKTLQNT